MQVNVTVGFYQRRQNNIFNYCAIFWMKRFSRQSQWHRVCLLSSGALWLANGCPGVRNGESRLADSRRWGGITSAATVKIGKELALLRAGKRNKRHKTENTYPGRKRGVRWKRTVQWSHPVLQQPKSEVFESVIKQTNQTKPKAQHLKRLGKKVPLCQPSSGSWTLFVQQATWTAACF